MTLFRRQSSRLLHKWAVWELVEVETLDPDGETFVRTFVDSPGAVGVVALSPDDSVTLVSQYRAAYDRPLWEIPAGLRDIPGEEPLLTGKRELAEEVGLMADRWDFLGRCSSAPGLSNSDVELYLAQDLGRAPIERHGPEEQHMVVEEFPLMATIEMIRHCAITDSKTIAALLLTRDFIRQH